MPLPNLYLATLVNVSHLNCHNWRRISYTCLLYDKYLRAERNKDEIFKIAKKLKSENSDVVGDKCVRDNSGLISYTDKAKLAAWKPETTLWQLLLYSYFELTLFYFVLIF